MHQVPEVDLRRRFFRLAWPNILSNVTVPLVGLVDTAMLGHLPDIRFLAGVALAAVIFDFAYWSFGFLRMGTTGITAQAVGRGDRQETFHVLYRGLLLGLAIGAGLLLLRGVIATVGFGLLSGPLEIESVGREYFAARIWGAPATLSNYVLLGWFLGRERPRAALVMTVVANLANVALDYVLIMQLGLAAVGAGIATALSQYLMLAVGLGLFWVERPRPALDWARVLNRARLGDLFRLNRDLMIRTLCLMSTFALFINFGALIGTTVLAANTILFRMQMLASYLIDGAAFATESLAGILRGRGDVKGLRRLLRLAVATGEAFALPVLILMFGAPAMLYGLLTSHGDVVAVVRQFAPWQAAVLVIGAVAFIYDGFFIGLTEGRVLRNQMLLSMLVFFLPLALLAVRARDNHLLWAAMTLFMIGRTLTLWLAGRRFLRTVAEAA